MAELKSVDVCLKCKAEAEFKKENIVFNEKYIVNGRSIFLTYYDCPKCNHRNYVQIDDSESLQVLEDVKEQMALFMVKRKMGKRITQKQSVSFNKSRKRLARIRELLKAEYTGVIVQDSKGGLWELRFNV